MAEKITLPAPEVPLVDPRTGKINEHWYIQLQRLLKALNGLLP